MRVLIRSTADRLASPGTASLLVLAVLAAVAFVFVGSCQAPLKQKKGYIGDFCNGADKKECQPGLICEDGVCTSNNDAPRVCSSVCGKFEACGFNVKSCNQSCLKTLRDWCKPKAEKYESCYEEAACGRIDEEKPWNYCYLQLELPDARLQGCKTMRQKAKSCLRNADAEAPKKVANMMNTCKTKARTVCDKKWNEEISICADQGNCGKLFQCINQNLDLAEDKQFPTSRPD